MDVLRRSVRKSRVKRIRNENTNVIMGVKGKPDFIDVIERKRHTDMATSKGCQRREYQN